MVRGDEGSLGKDCISVSGEKLNEYGTVDNDFPESELEHLQELDCEPGKLHLTDEERRKDEKRQHKQSVKEAKKAVRAGELGSIAATRKACDICERLCDLLVRCQVDETCQWKMVCVKGCWQAASGNQVDGTKEKPFYRYGGVWKNRRAGITGKKARDRR